MIQFIIPFIPREVEVLKAINNYHTPLLDSFMYMISFAWAWLPILICFIGYLFYKKDWRESLLFILMVVLCIVICDQLSSHIAKPFFARFRPSHYPEIQDSIRSVFGYKGGLYGFFSAHACNYISVVTFSALVIRDRISGILMFLYAVIVIYSRLYLGVHFISDVLVGSLVGLLVGYLLYRLYKTIRYKYVTMGHKPSKDVFKKGLPFLRISLILFFITLICYSLQVTKILHYINLLFTTSN